MWIWIKQGPKDGIPSFATRIATDDDVALSQKFGIRLAMDIPKRRILAKLEARSSFHYAVRRVGIIPCVESRRRVPFEEKLARWPAASPNDALLQLSVFVPS